MNRSSVALPKPGDKVGVVIVQAGPHVRKTYNWLHIRQVEIDQLGAVRP